LSASGFAFPLVFPQSYWITILIYVGIYGLIVVGYDLLLGYCGQIRSPQWIIRDRILCTAIMTAWLGWPPLIAMGAGVLITVLIAFFVGIRP